MEKVIELQKKFEIKPEKKKSSRNSFSFLLLKLFIILLCFSYVSHQYVYFTNNLVLQAISKYRDYRVKLLDYLHLTNNYNGIVISTDNKNLESLVNTYSAKYNIDPIVTWAMIQKESNGRPDRIRFEQSLKSQFSSKWKKEAWMNDIEYDMLFSTFGLMQVSYGFHKDRCGLDSFTDLFSIDKNLDCGLSFLSSCLDENRHINPSGARLRMCFRQYNGAGPMAERYADDLMSKLADFMVPGSKTDNRIALINNSNFVR